VTTRFNFLFSHFIDLEGNRFWKVVYIIYVLLPLNNHSFLLLVLKTGTTNKCNFA